MVPPTALSMKMPSAESFSGVKPGPEISITASVIGAPAGVPRISARKLLPPEGGVFSTVPKKLNVGLPP